MEVFIYLVAQALAIFVAGELGKPKNRNGYAWGFWLGWIGVIVVAALPKKE